MEFIHSDEMLFYIFKYLGNSLYSFNHTDDHCATFSLVAQYKKCPGQNSARTGAAVFQNYLFPYLATHKGKAVPLESR